MTMRPGRVQPKMPNKRQSLCDCSREQRGAAAPVAARKSKIFAKLLTPRCSAFVLLAVALAFLLPASLERGVQCAKLDARVKLLINDDDLLLEEPKHAVEAGSWPAGQHERDEHGHLSTYRSELKRLSYETIHRILRDENEPNYRREDGEIRKHHKRSYAAAHEVVRRSVAAQQGEGLVKVAATKRSGLGDSDSKNSGASVAASALPLLLAHNNTLAVLHLNGSGIRAGIAPNDYYLRELHLSGNEIESLALLNLTLLNALETLDLSCNRIRSVEASFFPQRMRNLKHLNLAHNRLNTIYRETFYNLLSLNTLLLTHNNITDIDYETFLALPNLQYLDLSYNRLRGESIRALQGIPDLMGLSIAYNPQVGTSMQEFVASWSLKELDASGTGLCQIPAALAQSVRTLKLTHNWLKVVNCGDLDSYPLLQYLDVSHSRIEDIEDDALGRLEILEVLFMDHNLLRKVPVSLPTSLEHLFLQHNQIQDIQEQAFRTLSNLQTLDLSGNQLLYVPALPLPKLLTLNLQSSGLKGLSQAIVHTLPRLRDLLLDDNPIKCSDLLGIAEWASPCRLAEHNPTTVKGGSTSDAMDAGQMDDAGSVEADPTPIITGVIDLKAKFIRLHDFFQMFKDVGAEACRAASPEVAEVAPACALERDLLGSSPVQPPVQSPDLLSNTPQAAARATGAARVLPTAAAVAQTTQTSQDSTRVEVEAKSVVVTTATTAAESIVPTGSGHKGHDPVECERKLFARLRAGEIRAGVAVVTSEQPTELPSIASVTPAGVTATAVTPKAATATTYKTTPAKTAEKEPPARPIADNQIEPKAATAPSNESTVATEGAAGAVPTSAAVVLAPKTPKCFIASEMASNSSQTVQPCEPATATTTMANDAAAQGPVAGAAIQTISKTIKASSQNGDLNEKPIVSNAVAANLAAARTNTAAQTTAADREWQLNGMPSEEPSQQQQAEQEWRHSSRESSRAAQHLHEHLQVDPKDRHLIGTPLLMHRGQNLLLETRPLRPATTNGTAAAPSGPTTTETPKTAKAPGLEGSQKEHQPPPQQSGDMQWLQALQDDGATTGKLDGMERPAATQMPPITNDVMPTQLNRNADASGPPPTATTANKPTATVKRPPKRHEDKKKLSLTMKKMTFTTKHTATAAPAMAAADQPPAQRSQNVLSTNAAYGRSSQSGQYKEHNLVPPAEHEMADEPAATPAKHSTVNTAIGGQQAPQQLTAIADQQLQADAMRALRTSPATLQQQEQQQEEDEQMPEHTSAASAQWLDKREADASSGHSGTVILLTIVMFAVLLLGLMHVYRCELPWRRQMAPQQRPHQRQLNENDADSFLSYNKQSTSTSPPPQPPNMQSWHHSTRSQPPYNSPLHNLHVRELQKSAGMEEKVNMRTRISLNIKRGNIADSGARRPSAHISSSSSLTGPREDTFYMEAPQAGEQHSDFLPMELLNVSASSTARRNDCEDGVIYVPVSSKMTMKLKVSLCDKDDVKPKPTRSKFSFW